MVPASSPLIVGVEPDPTVAALTMQLPIEATEPEEEPNARPVTLSSTAIALLLVTGVEDAPTPGEVDCMRERYPKLTVLFPLSVCEMLELMPRFGSEQVPPAEAAIGIVTALLTTLPLTATTETKQPVGTPFGTVTWTWSTPGN
jgi:hypothetical protein